MASQYIYDISYTAQSQLTVQNNTHREIKEERKSGNKGGEIRIGPKRP